MRGELLREGGRSDIPRNVLTQMLIRKTKTIERGRDVVARVIARQNGSRQAIGVNNPEGLSRPICRIVTHRSVIPGQYLLIDPSNGQVEEVEHMVSL